MRDEHIINILESKSFASLSESEHSTIRTHTASCAECARAYTVAKVSSSLLQERMSETVEPSPFFHTRVLAAIRAQNETPAFARLWRAAGALVSSMTAAVVLLAALSFMAPTTEQLTPDALAYTEYSAEEVILDETIAAEQSDAQLWSTIYEAEEDER